jgi:hypothetical protein
MSVAPFLNLFCHSPSPSKRMVGAWCRLVATMPNKFKRADILEANLTGTAHFSFRVNVAAACESPRSARTGLKAQVAERIHERLGAGGRFREPRLRFKEICRREVRVGDRHRRKAELACIFWRVGFSPVPRTSRENRFPSRPWSLNFPPPNNSSP